MKDSEPLTGTVEDYLKAIYELERGSAAAGTNDIAQLLALTPASVTGMVKRLADQGLLAYEPYRGVKLTEAGRRAALRTLRRHRVIESYLVQVLGYSWDRVHDEAERLEHAASEELVDRMAESMGEPAVDPHGAPIPARDGTIDERDYHSLSDLGEGVTARVVRVGDDNPQMLRYLFEVGIVPSVEVTVVERAPFGGPISIRVNETELSIGPALAGHVLVEPIPDAEAPAH